MRCPTETSYVFPCALPSTVYLPFQKLPTIYINVSIYLLPILYCLISTTHYLPIIHLLTSIQHPAIHYLSIHPLLGHSLSMNSLHQLFIHYIFSHAYSSTTSHPLSIHSLSTHYLPNLCVTMHYSSIHCLCIQCLSIHCLAKPQFETINLLTLKMAILHGVHYVTWWSLLIFFISG